MYIYSVSTESVLICKNYHSLVPHKLIPLTDETLLCRTQYITS